MRTSQNWTAKKMGLLTTLLLLPVCAWSQATSSLLIPLNNQTIQRVDNYNSKIDLLKEARLLKPALKNVSNIEIQMVRVEAKSGVGGAQIFLKVNNDLVAAAAVETNPDLFSSTDVRSFEKFELKNIDRARVSLANVLLQNAQNLKIKSLEIIFGSVQEPVVFGDYANKQASQIGGALLNDNRDMRPSKQAVNTIQEKLYGNVVDDYEEPVITRPTVQPTPVRPQPTRPQPVVVRPTPVKPKPAPVSNRCVVNYRNVKFCIGDIALNKWDWPQKIIAIDQRTNEVTLVSDMYDGPYTQHVDMLKK